jgi:Ser/Thr protein kinase RdoA (MazF antagonist)
MFRRNGVNTLPAHLEEVLGVTVSRVRQLDIGVFRVDRRTGTPMVARLFSARRAHAAVVGDLAVLKQLQAAEFPAERPFGPGALSMHDDQSVLVTHFVRGAAKPDVPAGDPVVALGALVGRLHRLARPAGAADRPAGALHHYAEGTPADELRAARRWLRDIEPRVAVADRDQLDLLEQALADADDAAGLPEAFVHPDPVMKNTVFTKDGLVLVDWAGAGRGPRIASLALMLRSGWAGCAASQPQSASRSSVCPPSASEQARWPPPPLPPRETRRARPRRDRGGYHRARNARIIDSLAEVGS